jgi:PA domain-containing protein
LERDDLELPMQDSLVFARGATYGTIPAVPMSILPFDRPRHGHADIDTYWSLVAPRARAEISAPKRSPLPVALMDTSARIDGTSKLAVVDAGTGTTDDFAGTDVTGKLVLLAETGSMTYTEQAKAAASHGAAAVLISSSQPGSFYGRASAGIPVLAIERDQGDALRRLLDRRQPVTVTLSGSSRAAYLYDLVFRKHDQLGHSLVYRPAHLATVRPSFHAMDGYRSQRFFEKRFPAWTAVCGYCGILAREGEDWHGGVTRTDYVTAGTDWQESVLQDSSVQWNATRSYPFGLTDTSFGRAPVAPGVPIAAGISSVRDGDTVKLRLAPYTDGDPRHYSNGVFGFGRYTSVALDGVPLGSCGSGTALSCDVNNAPAEHATYTVTADFPALGPSEVVPPSTTTWTFGSARGEPVVPLIDLDYSLPVGLANTMRAGTPTALTIGVRHQPGAVADEVREVRVELSYDDGGNWTPVHATRTSSGTFRVGYRNPDLSANGFVGIRVSATDPQGNSIVQQVLRAYRITAGP